MWVCANSSKHSLPFFLLHSSPLHLPYWVIFMYSLRFPTYPSLLMTVVQWDTNQNARKGLDNLFFDHVLFEIITLIYLHILVKVIMLTCSYQIFLLTWVSNCLKVASFLLDKTHIHMVPKHHYLLYNSKSNWKYD